MMNCGGLLVWPKPERNCYGILLICSGTVSESVIISGFPAVSMTTVMVVQIFPFYLIKAFRCKRLSFWIISLANAIKFGYEIFIS